MLMLTRSIGSSITIGDEIKVTVLSIRGSQVRIAIQAPEDISIYRQEIHYKILQEQSERQS